MFPEAQQDTFNQGPSKKEEFETARKIRIHAEPYHLFDRQSSREHTLLAHPIQQDVLENGVDLALAAPDVVEEPQVQV